MYVFFFFYIYTENNGRAKQSHKNRVDEGCTGR